MEPTKKDLGSLDEGTPDDSEQQSQVVQNFASYEKISELRISGWENFYHVRKKRDEGDDTGPSVALVTLNKPRYIDKFSRLIEEDGEWDNEDEIPALAEKEFDKVNQEFGERYKRIMKLPPHRSLPKVLYVERDAVNGLYFAELEYVSGNPFLAIVLSPFQILALATDLFGGLKHMHDHDLLHRRIKSDNVYIHTEGKKPVVKFTSWGLAVPIDKAQGDRSGSQHYVAPEVLFKGRIGPSADLWSVGSLLYRALTGKYPFPERDSARNLKELLNIAEGEKPPDELAVYSHFQKMSAEEKREIRLDKLQELLNELLKPNPEERGFKNAKEVVNFIHANWPKVLQGAPETKDLLTFTISSGGK